ncbi:hypothetical protein Moror_4078 [Moniliophthora roreri MCA 2997]|uniref:Uncharacterized protein n=1 Tax=Moniliophthora roreri (strain MCA 2997) TaxID=1381753 RepID=V2XD55_MONRO|nr:hypothetical protein Moror_4078 [Moniliophthora roreri MCA 2997]
MSLRTFSTSGSYSCNLDASYREELLQEYGQQYLLFLLEDTPDASQRARDLWNSNVGKLIKSWLAKKWLHICTGLRRLRHFGLGLRAARREQSKSISMGRFAVFTLEIRIPLCKLN